MSAWQASSKKLTPTVMLACSIRPGLDPTREQTEDVPVLGSAEGGVAVFLCLCQLEDLEPRAEFANLGFIVERHVSVRRVPFVAWPEEDAGQRAARQQGSLQPDEHRIECRRRVERQSELGVDEVVAAELELVEGRDLVSQPVLVSNCGDHSRR